MRQAIDLYKNYGMYTNTEKMLPSIIDGLLPVHRRMLLVLHNIASTTKVKTVTANGELLGKYHPHAESTGPAVWAVCNDFATGYGQWGSYIGIEEIKPAAARYTSIKASSTIEKMVMKYVNYVQWDLNELDFEEPKYLPTQFPLCLMGKEYLSSIGFGIKTDIPIYEVKDLHKRLLFLLGKIDKEPIISPYIPNCEILSNKKDIKKLLTDGEITLQIKGKYVEDKKNNQIYVLGWKPRKTFETVYKSIARYKSYGLFESESVGILDESNANNGNYIRFEVLKQRNVKETYDKLKEAIDHALTSNLRFAMYVVDETGKNFKLSNVDEMLLTCFKHYKETYQAYCIHSVKKIKDQIDEYEIIKRIKPHVSTLTANAKQDVSTSITKLSQLSGDSEENVKKVIEKYNIKKLLSFDLDKTQLLSELKEFKTKLNNLEEYVLKEYVI